MTQRIEMRVTVTERRAMQAFHLVEGTNNTARAKRFSRGRHYIRRGPGATNAIVSSFSITWRD